MNNIYSGIDFHKFVDEKLEEKGFKIVVISRDLMLQRTDDFMNFVNGIRYEYKDHYKWKEESTEYFLNGLNDKWKYSFSILDQNNNICFLNLTSVYGHALHLHCAYASKDSRNFNFAKLNMIKQCQTGLDNGFTYMDAYWPKNNSRSIILYLKMGWQIQDIRKKTELLMDAELEKVRNQTYRLIVRMK